MSDGEEMKHKYTVSIVRAVFNKACFEVFKKYEASIHKKHDKSKASYENFLCQSPLYDPRHEDERKLSQFEDDLDNLRSRDD